MNGRASGQPIAALPARTHHGRTTTDEINARVEEVGRLLALRRTRTQIHQEATKRWGCHWQTVNRYVRRARENAMRALGRTKEDCISQAIAFNHLVMQSDAEWRDKLAAHRDNNELLGLYPPKIARLKGSGPGGAVEITNRTVIVESPIDPEEVTGPTRAQDQVAAVRRAG